MRFTGLISLAVFVSAFTSATALPQERLQQRAAEFAVNNLEGDHVQLYRRALETLQQEVAIELAEIERGNTLVRRGKKTDKVLRYFSKNARNRDNQRKAEKVRIAQEARRIDQTPGGGPPQQQGNPDLVRLGYVPGFGASGSGGR